MLRADLVAAAREAGDAGFDALIACAFIPALTRREFGTHQNAAEISELSLYICDFRTVVKSAPPMLTP